MIVFPAIDILGGAAVRLAQGDYERVTVYNNDPVAQARAWVEQGAEWVHVVDLDGARDGTPGNIDVVQTIVQQVGVPVQVGGGIRSHETLERLADAGASRMVLGTKLATDPQFVRDAVAAHGEAIVAGVDARGGEVQIAGWRKGARLPATELIAELSGLGVAAPGVHGRQPRRHADRGGHRRVRGGRRGGWLPRGGERRYRGN